MCEQACVEQPSLPPDSRSAEAANALFAATSQIGLAMHESHDPVAELGSLLAHLVETLSALRSSPLATSVDPVQATVVHGLLEHLQSDVFRGIQQLQFYDRLVQHLSHLQAYMIAVANELGSGKDGDPWYELHARLRKRLISDEQRILLDLFLTPSSATNGSTREPDPGHSPPGSLELF
jgi:hypothetical protein